MLKICSSSALRAIEAHLRANIKSGTKLDEGMEGLDEELIRKIIVQVLKREAEENSKLPKFSCFP